MSEVKNDLSKVTIGPGTVLRNDLGVEIRITGLVTGGACIGQLYRAEDNDPFHRALGSPLRFATREGLQTCGYSVVSNEEDGGE